MIAVFARGDAGLLLEDLGKILLTAEAAVFRNLRDAVVSIPKHLLGCGDSLVDQIFMWSHLAGGPKYRVKMIRAQGHRICYIFQGNRLCVVVIDKLLGGLSYADIDIRKCVDQQGVAEDQVQ